MQKKKEEGVSGDRDQGRRAAMGHWRQLEAVAQRTHAVSTLTHAIQRWDCAVNHTDRHMNMQVLFRLSKNCSSKPEIQSQVFQNLSAIIFPCKDIIC